MVEDAVRELDPNQAVLVIDHEETDAAFVGQVVDADLQVDAPAGGPDDDGLALDGLEANLVELEPDGAGVLELLLQRVPAHQHVDILVRPDRGSVEQRVLGEPSEEIDRRLERHQCLEQRSVGVHGRHLGSRRMNQMCGPPSGASSSATVRKPKRS